MFKKTNISLLILLAGVGLTGCFNKKDSKQDSVSETTQAHTDKAAENTEAAGEAAATDELAAALSNAAQANEGEVAASASAEAKTETKTA